MKNLKNIKWNWKTFIIFSSLILNTSLIITLPIVITQINQKHRDEIKKVTMKQYLYDYLSNSNKLYKDSLRSVGNRSGCHMFKELISINYLHYLHHQKSLYTYGASIFYNSFDGTFPNSIANFQLSIDAKTYFISYNQLGNNWVLNNFLEPNSSGADIKLIKYLEINHFENLKGIFHSFFNNPSEPIDPTSIETSTTGFQFLNYLPSGNKYINSIIHITWKETGTWVHGLTLNSIYDVNQKEYQIIGLISNK
ncbi:MAG: hypothetical protein ACRDCG_02740 [Mycoplasmoidaceae bacterium]